MVFRNSESSMFFMRMILFSDEKRVCVKVYLCVHFFGISDKELCEIV